MNWILNNKEWIFSGFAVAIPLSILGWFFASKKNKQIQKSGNDSTNIQIGGNITINERSDKNNG